MSANGLRPRSRASYLIPRRSHEQLPDHRRQPAEANPGQFTGYRIDVDTDTDTVTRYGVMSIPTIVLLRDGHEIVRLDGLIREQDLEEAVHGGGR